MSQREAAGDSREVGGQLEDESCLSHRLKKQVIRQELGCPFEMSGGKQMVDSVSQSVPVDTGRAHPPAKSLHHITSPRFAEFLLTNVIGQPLMPGLEFVPARV
jgi:hypothetical protein